MRDTRVVGRLRTRGARRWMVGAVALGWVLTTAAILAGGAAWTRLVPMLATVAVGVLLTLATRNVSNAIDAFADERDRALRDRATRLAYWALGVPLGMMVGALIGAVEGETAGGGTATLTAQSLRVLWAGCWTLFALYAALPMSILAWTEPDLPDFGDEEE